MYLWEFIETVDPETAIRIDTILVEKNPITEQYEYKGETEGTEMEAGMYPYVDINPLRSYYVKFMQVDNSQYFAVGVLILKVCAVNSVDYPPPEESEPEQTGEQTDPANGN